MSPITPEARAEFLDRQRAKFGVNYVLNAGDIVKRGPKGKIPFLSPMMTWATTGGVPFGHVCRWYGQEHSGKSLQNWGLLYVAQNYPRIITEIYETDIHWLENHGKAFAAHKLAKQLDGIISRYPDGLSAVIYDTEGRAEALFMQQLGIDTDDVWIFHDNIVEELCDSMEDAFRSGIDIVILDSATNTMSMAEAEAKPGDELVGTKARAWSRWANKVRRQMNPERSIWLVVDQLRTKVQLGSGRMGNPVGPPDIKWFRHNATLAIYFEPGKYLYLDKNGVLTDDYKSAAPGYKALGTVDGKEIHGLEMKCKVEKNSTGRPFRFPVWERRYGEVVQEIGWDESFELLEMGTYFEIIEKAGSRYYPLDENFERIAKNGKGRNRTDVSWHGEGQAKAAISGDIDLRTRILHRATQDI
jgi:RecA/RadA recombinase